MSFTEDKGQEAADIFIEVLVCWLKICMAPLRYYDQ